MNHTESGNNSHISASAIRSLSKLLQPYQSGWVAVTPDERKVVAAADTLRETRKQAETNHVSDAVYIKVIPPNQGYIPRLQ